MAKYEQLVSDVSDQLTQIGWSHIKTGLDPQDKDAINTLFAQLEPCLSSESSRNPEHSIISPSAVSKTLADSQNEMSFHTDNVYLETPCKNVALFCIQQAQLGGNNELVDGLSVLDELSHESISALQLPSWSWHNPVTGIPSEKFSVVGNDGESLRWWRTTMVVKEIGLIAVADKLEDAINNSDTRISLKLNPGDLLVTDNSRILHNRHKFSGNRVMYRARFW